MKKNLMSFDNCYLRVATITNGKDKSPEGIPYKVVTFDCFKLLGKKEHKLKGSATRTLWPKQYTRQVGGVDTIFRGDSEFDTIVVGDTFSGGIFQCETTPYTIGVNGPQITSWKGVVFEGENPLVIAGKALRQNNAAPRYYDEETEEMTTFHLQTVNANNGKPSTSGLGPDITDDVNAEKKEKVEDPE